MKRQYTQFDVANRTARYLLELEAVRFQPDEPVEFSSGRTSPIYVDTRLVFGVPKARADITRMAFATLANKVGTRSFQVIAGGETAGIPFATMIADRADKPMVYVRKQPKRFGRCAQIEGFTDDQLSLGRKFLLVEDMCSEGGSKQNFINAIRQSGNIVNDILVIYSYGCFGASTLLAQDGVQLHPLTDGQTLIDVAEDLEFYPPPVIAEMRRFLTAPDAYSARYEKPTVEEQLDA